MIFKTYRIQAVCIERDVEFSDVPCGECNQCCIHLSPLLTPEEFESGKYIYTLTTTPNTSLPAFAIPRDKNGCYYLKDGKCSIYNDRPKACRQFDCRKGHYPQFKDLALRKFNEYSEE